MLSNLTVLLSNAQQSTDYPGTIMLNNVTNPHEHRTFIHAVNMYNIQSFNAYVRTLNVNRVHTEHSVMYF